MKKWVILIGLIFVSTNVSLSMASEKGSMMESATIEESASTAAESSGETYAIDVSHSMLGFAVKHLGVSKTRGNFDDFDGNITYDPEAQELNADVTIQVTSIDTDNEKRDDHLRSADFFEAEVHPTITFNNSRLKSVDGQNIIFGDLTIKGVTKTITIPVEISGPVVGMKGASVIGIAGQTTINRKDFNINWSKQLDNGGLVVDNNVELIIEIEAKAG